MEMTPREERGPQLDYTWLERLQKGRDQMSEQTDALSSKTKSTIVSDSPSLVSKNFDIFGSPDYYKKRDHNHTSAKRQLIQDD